jgi:hypothetical protein
MRKGVFKNYGALIILGLGLLFSSSACKHEVPTPITQNDNGNGGSGGNNGGNGGGGNGGGSTGIPCNEDSVYFEQQILPFLISTCAKPGCHNTASAEDDVILDSYFSVMNSDVVEPFDLSDSDLWEVITTNDPDDMMPPPGNAPLTQAQLDLIALWINQGAQNLTCNENYGSCDTTNVTWLQTIRPLIQNKCQGCHSSPNPGGGVDLTTHGGVQTVALNGRLMGSLDHLAGYSPMPQNVNNVKLPDCELEQIRHWVNQGAPNN